MMMNLVEKITLVMLEGLADKLELCITDYAHGGFLSPEKRAIRQDCQGRAATLARQAARLHVLDHEPELRSRLLLFARVLNNEVSEMPSAAVLAKAHPRRG